jgi:acetyl esterase/lipase
VTDLPPFLWPFVLPHTPVQPVRVDGIDYYLPARTPAPGMVFVHGGPVPAEIPIRPPDWSAYRAYGALAAGAGAVGVVFEHGYSSPDALDQALLDCEDALRAVRASAHVDGERVVVFAFSGGGVLLGPLLDADPPWLRGVGLTYAMCAHSEESSSTFTTPIQANTSTPILLTRAEYEERAWLIESNDALAATHDLDIIEVAGAQHGFETMDDTDAARAAIGEAIAWAAERLGLSADSRAHSR